MSGGNLSTTDTVLATLWTLILCMFALWACSAASPELERMVEKIGQFMTLAIPLFTAYRVHCNVQVRYAPAWAIGLWCFSLLLLVGKYGHSMAALQQTAVITASLLFILIPYPIQRVWGELLRRCRKERQNGPAPSAPPSAPLGRTAETMRGDETPLEDD